MENPFRRFLASRRLSSTSSANKNRSLDDLALHSVAYDATSPSGKLPVFIHQPLRKGTVFRRTRDDLDELAIRAFSYDSTAAGKPPVMGGRPLKGNGPVKLQTNRRLSSGELMATSQEPERTLEDIREGEYIIGRKEKRLSRASQAQNQTPLAGNKLSPRLLSTEGTSSSPHLPLARTISHNSIKNSFAAPSRNLTSSMPNSPHLSNFSAQVADDATSASAFEVPPTTGQSSIIVTSTQPVARGSLLSDHEQQNATIQALWKAEYSRLVAIYGKDGVDRNIAELNHDRRSSSSPERSKATLDAMTALGMTLEPLPKPSLDSGSDLATRRHSRLSSFRDTSSTEEVSDYASTVRSSVTSSDTFPSSHTARTSGFEPDLPTTREDVRKVVEDMRSTYLRAIEAKGNEGWRPKKAKKRKERASYSAAGHVPSKSVSKTKRPTRQSWHPSNAPEAPSPVIRMERPERRRETIQAVQSSPARSLQRADSMTLGSMMPSTPKAAKKSNTSKSSQYHESPQTPQAVLASPTDLTVHDYVMEHNDRDVLEPEIAPEIDDFDIFYYQDLYGPPPTASSMPSLPIRKHTSMQYAEASAAPPPPNIDRTPRRRYLSQI